MCDTQLIKHKKLAIETIKSIQSGEGLVRNRFPDSMKGRLAKNLWNEGHFHLGMEYGAILALMDIFDITVKDLK